MHIRNLSIRVTSHTRATGALPLQRANRLRPAFHSISSQCWLEFAKSNSMQRIPQTAILYSIFRLDLIRHTASNLLFIAGPAPDPAQRRSLVIREIWRSENQSSHLRSPFCLAHSRNAHDIFAVTIQGKRSPS